MWNKIKGSTNSEVMHSYIKSMLLPSHELQDDGEGSTSEVDESIEVEVDPIASCAHYNSYASHGDIASVIVICSEARSDSNVEADPTLDERDGVCVHSEKDDNREDGDEFAYVKEECIEDCIAEECILEEVHNNVEEVVAMEDKREVGDVVAIIKDEYIVEECIPEEALEQDIINEALDIKEEKECFPEEAQEQDIIDEALEIKEEICSVVEIVKDDEAVTDINSTSLVEVDQLEDTGAMFTGAPPRSRVRELMMMWQKSVTEKEEEKDYTKVEGVDDGNAVAVIINEEYIVESEQEANKVQSVVQEKKKEKECTKVDVVDDQDGVEDINEECIAQSVQQEDNIVQIVLAEKNEECIQVERTTGDGELETKVKGEQSTTLDCITQMENDMIEIIDEKRAENSHLAEQLILFKAKIQDLEAENRSLVLSSEENAQVVSMLGEDIAEKNFMIDKMSEDIVQLSAKCDDISSTSADIIKARSSENSNLTEQLQLSKTKNEGLQAEVQNLVKVISMLGEEVTEKNAMIEKMNEDTLQRSTKSDKIISTYADLIKVRSAENADLTEQLRLSKTKIEELQAEVQNLVANSEDAQLLAAKSRTLEIHVLSLTSNNNENIKQISSLEKDSEAKQIAIDEMSADMNNKTASLKEKSAQIDILNERLRLSETECIDRRAEIEELIASKTDMIQQMSVLEDDLTSKKVLIDKMITDIEQKSKLLEEKSVEIVDIYDRLQISLAEKYGLKTEVDSLLAINNEHVKNISSLNEDLAAKTIVIDEMNGKIRFKIALLEDKSVEIADLKEQLKLTEAKIADQRVEMDDLVAMNEKHYGLIFSLENELEVKKMELADVTEQLQQSQVEGDRCHAEMDALAAINKTNAGLISSLQDELKSKKMNFEDRLLQSQGDVDKLKVKNEGLVAINEENVGLISLMEEDLKVKTLTISDLTKKLQSVEITDIKERFNSIGCTTVPFSLFFPEATTCLMNDISHAKINSLVAMNKSNDGLVSSLENELDAEKMKNEEMTMGIRQTSALLKEKSAEILLLTERLNLAMNENNELKTRVEALVASSTEYVQNISTLKEELETKKIEIHETNTSLVAMHEESSAIAILMEQLQQSNASMEGLKREMHGLGVSKKEYVNKMSLLEDEVTAKQVTIDALNVEIQTLHSTCEELATELSSLMNESKTSNDAMQLDYVNKMSLLEDEVTDKQLTIDALNVEIRTLHSTCEELATELSSLMNESKTSNDAMQLDLSKTSMKSEKVTTELQGPLLSMPDLLIDEKSSSDKQLQDMVMNKGVEDKVRLYEQSLGNSLLGNPLQGFWRRRRNTRSCHVP
jgi:chromosome segregation ATPase